MPKNPSHNHSESPPILLGTGRSTQAVAQHLFSCHRVFYYSQSTSIDQEVSQQFEAWGGHYIEPNHLNGLCAQQGITTAIVSPGISPQSSLIQSLENNGISIMTEIDWAYRNLSKPQKTIGITGTNGKSTVCTMISHLANQIGHQYCRSAGNIGTPLTTSLLEHPNPEWSSLELSSYQLEYMTTQLLNVGILTTFSPDHLERHQSMTAYAQAKLRIHELTKDHGFFITTDDVIQQLRELGVPWQPRATIKTIILLTHSSDQNSEMISYLSSMTPDVEFARRDSDRFQWRGRWHTFNPLAVWQEPNLTNAALASLGVVSIAHPDHMQSDFINENMWQNFESLPYRAQVIATHQNSVIINDSKGTNVAATCALLRSRTNPYYLLLGGLAKDESFEDLVEFGPWIKTVIAFGSSAQMIANQLKNAIPTLCFPTLELALLELQRLWPLDPLDIIFSPACASFDEFKNFEDRGAFFTKFITKTLMP